LGGEERKKSLEKKFFTSLWWGYGPVKLVWTRDGGGGGGKRQGGGTIGGGIQSRVTVWGGGGERYLGRNRGLRKKNVREERNTVWRSRREWEGGRDAEDGGWVDTLTLYWRKGTQSMGGKRRRSKKRSQINAGNLGEGGRDGNGNIDAFRGEVTSNSMEELVNVRFSAVGATLVFNKMGQGKESAGGRERGERVALQKGQLTKGEKLLYAGPLWGRKNTLLDLKVRMNTE